MKVSTLTLIKRLQATRDMASYYEKYNDEIINTPPHEYLQALAEQKGMTAAKLKEKSGLGDYIYKIWWGKRAPGRNTVVAISLALGLDLAEMNKYLRIAGFGALDPRRRKDSALIFAAEKRYTVMETNELLDELGEELL